MEFRPICRSPPCTSNRASKFFQKIWKRLDTGEESSIFIVVFSGGGQSEALPTWKGKKKVGWCGPTLMVRSIRSFALN